jgi:hypothetical protein
MTARFELDPNPAHSMICASCDGPMVITKDAVGRARLRCPSCQGVAKPYRHPDDAMLPQGLVPVNGAPPRVIREVVRVEVPAPAIATRTVVELPPLESGHLRCQLCGVGINPHHRFCGDCAEGGQLILAALRLRERAERGDPPRARYKPKPCQYPVDPESGQKCGELFTPTGARSDYCDRHRVETMRAKWRAERKAHRAKDKGAP